MIDRKHPLPISKQTLAVGISRDSMYYQSRPVSEQDQKLMRMIDQLHLEYPFAGSRMLRDFMGLDGIKVGRKHVATLMMRMGIEKRHKKRGFRKVLNPLDFSGGADETRTRDLRRDRPAL